MVGRAIKRQATWLDMEGYAAMSWATSIDRFCV